MSETYGVRGRVLGEDGQPLAGVHVISSPQPHSAMTDADGRFAFDGLERTKSYWMWAREGDCYTPFVHVNTEEDVELRMRRGTTLIARVLADGQPLAGATVVLSRPLRAVTDEHGIATIRGIPPISITGHVLADGRATHRLQLQFDTKRLLLDGEDAGGVVEQTFELERGAEVCGRVVDQSGSPISDVAVILTGPTQELGAETGPHADGSWSVCIGAGRYQIEARSSPWRVSQTLTVDCDGQTPQRDLVLRVGSPLENAVYGRIAGVVIDDQGRPAAGAHVRVCRPQVRMYDWAGRADRDGRFESREIGATGEVEVIASWESLRKDVILRARPGEMALELVLPAGATIVGRVLLDGAPVPYFGVRLVLEQGRHSTPRPLPRSSNVCGPPSGVRAEDGRFALPHVPAGTRRLSLIGPGTRLAITEEILVTGNETIDLGDVVLERGDRITGFVRDRSGAPVADARVFVGRLAFMSRGLQLENWFHGRYETRTDATGAYTLDGVDTDHNETFPEIVQATHPTAGHSAICALPHADATLDFVLLGRGRIAGTIRNLRSAAAVVRADEPLLARFALVDKEGHFELDVAPGDYMIKGTHEDSPSTQVTVLDGQTVQATLVMDGATSPRDGA
ncbi:MAG: hypothetical protein H0V17_29735 [Deltaproteobacteria bacterium]|nr:hypothetical protein [Deltaproteobacteria bacterium]